MLVLNTVFSAVDRMSAPVRGMAGAVNQLNASLNRIPANTFGNLATGVGKKLAYLKDVLIAGGLVAGIYATGNALMEYDKQLGHLRALTGATGAEFLKFKDIINKTAKETLTSSVDVATAFTNIANSMPNLINDADGLALVTKASITLAHAASMELAPAAQSLSDIMGKFRVNADGAAKTIDVIAAGSRYGSAEINDLTQSLQEFGGTAQMSGVSLNESVAIMELVSKVRKGTQAGIEFRNVLAEMNKGIALDPKALQSMYRFGVDVRKIADASVPIVDRFRELSKIMGHGGETSNAMFNLVGKQNMEFLDELMTKRGGLPELINQVNELGNANNMAAQNENTLYAALKRVSDMWVTTITSSGSAGVGIKAIIVLLDFLATHINGIVNVLMLWGSLNVVVGIFNLYIKAAAGGFRLLNIIVGVTAALFGKALPAGIAATESGFAATVITTRILSMSMASLAIAIPVVLGLIAAAYAIFKSFNNSQDETVAKLGKTEEGFHKLAKPITAADVALTKYNEALDKYNDKRKGLVAERYDVANELAFAKSQNYVSSESLQEKLNYLDRKLSDTSAMPKAGTFFQNGLANPEDLTADINGVKGRYAFSRSDKNVIVLRVENESDSIKITQSEQYKTQDIRVEVAPTFNKTSTR